MAKCVWHLAEVDFWDTLVKNYLRNAEDAKLRVKTVMAKKVDTTYLRDKLLMKIRLSFSDFYKKIEEYKARLEEEIWIAFSKDAIKSTQSKGDDTMGKLLKRLEESIKSVEGAKEKPPKFAGMDYKLLEDAKELMKSGKDEKKALLKAEQMVTDFKMQDNLTYDKFKNLFNIQASFLGGGLLEKYGWGKYGSGPGGRVITKPKGDKVGWLSYGMNCVLPEFFQIDFRINNFTKHTMIGIGISKKPFETRPGDVISYNGDSWAGTEDGKVYCYEGAKVEEEGNDSATQKGDIMSIVYDSQHKMSFEMNGKRQPKGFVNIEGPFYVYAALAQPETVLELISIAELEP